MLVIDRQTDRGRDDDGRQTDAEDGQTDMLTVDRC